MSDLSDQRWLDQQVTLLGEGIEAAKEIWNNWYDLRNVERLHPGMSPGEYISSLGFRLTLAEAMAALPDGSNRQVAAVAGVSNQTVMRARRAAPDGAPDQNRREESITQSIRVARVIGADGKSYPGRVVGEVIEPEQKEAQPRRRATLTEVRQQIRILQGVLYMLVPDEVVPSAIPVIREFAPTLEKWIQLWDPTEK